MKTTVTARCGKCIHQLFEAQVERTPNAVAVEFAGRCLTYRELNARSNQLAHHLKNLGVGANVLVGIYVERSLEMLVGLLGILKAGGAYLPFDTTCPQERLAYMLADAQLSMLVTQSNLVPLLPKNSARIVCLDGDWEAVGCGDGENPGTMAKSDHLAYVIYTSGSTGKPKGVKIRHGSVTNLLNSMQVTPGLTDRDVVLGITTISFDASVPELYLPLVVGAKIVLVSRDVAADGHKLLQEIDRSQATVIQGTPTIWQLLLAVGWAGHPSLKIICGGEALSPKLADRLLARAGAVWNMYGPTEATVCATAYQVKSPLDRCKSTVPVGKPLHNIQTYILDAHQQPVPVGICGELYLGGACLAAGYLNRPELTAERFIDLTTQPHALGGKGRGERLYKTGDLARYLPDGNIEYLGRMDEQVKIRGFRIELGEVEAVIAQHPDVQQSVVTIQEFTPEDRRLVAYLVATPERVPTVAELRNFLQSKLPSYMVPVTFSILTSLPLTANGKVDRRALPALEHKVLQPEDVFSAPRNRLEIQLTKIWHKVLGLQSIGIRDNFFELGGHSLLAVRLFAEIEQTWGKHLPLATLFQAPTIEKMANILHQKGWVAPWSSLVPIQPNGSKPPLFCIHPIGGNILEYYPLAHHLGDEQPIYGLQSQGLDGQQKPLSRVEEMASHYIKDILAIQPHGPYLLLGYSFGGLIAFEIAQQLYAQDKKVAFLGLVDLTYPNLQKVRPSFAKSIQIHLRNLWHLQAQDRPKYIRNRIDYRFKNVDYRELMIKSLSEIAPHSPQLLNLIDTNFQASRDYTAQPYPGDVSLFRCQVQTLDYSLSTDLGWGEFVDGKLEIYDVPSIHYKVLREPSIRVVAEKIKLCLEKV